jgi:hypothetical protein
MLSGGQDTFIDVDQTCEISATLGSAASNWLLVDNHYASSTGSRPVCSQLTWYSAPGNAAWDAGASLAETNWNLVWSESGQHGLMSNGTAWGVFSAFVNERLAWGPTVPSTPLQSASGDNNP